MWLQAEVFIVLSLAWAQTIDTLELMGLEVSEELFGDGSFSDDSSKLITKNLSR